MASPLTYAIPSPLEYFRALVAEDDGLPLLEAAIAVAQDDIADLDSQSVLAEVDSLAFTLKRRVPADAGAVQRLRMLNVYFFKELGFAGNLNDYYDRRNSYVSAVLSTRRGIPITLALLYMELASQIGLRACGVSFPGHFLVKLRMPKGEVVIDPFNGQSLTREVLLERLLPFQHPSAEAEEDNIALAHFLRPARPRAILARLLRNLKEVHRAAADLPRQLAVLNRLVVLLPDELQERRDRGLVLAAMGRMAAACEDVQAYLQERPMAADAQSLRQKLARWLMGEAAGVSGLSKRRPGEGFERRQ